MDRSAFREELRRALQEILLGNIQQHVEEQFQAHRQQLKYISAMDRKYNSADLIKQGMPGVLNQIRESLHDEQQETLFEIYVSAIDEVAQQFPEQTQWEQSEDRFTVLDGDSVAVSTGKAVKRFGRSLSRLWHKSLHVVNSSDGQWKPWMQQVPMQRLVTYHLLQKHIVKSWMEGVERIWLAYITDLENQIILAQDEDEILDLTQFVTSFQDWLDKQKLFLDNEISEGIDRMESEIIEQVEKTGTIERRNAFYSEHRISSSRSDFQKELKETQDLWRQPQQLLLERVENVTNFLNLSDEIRQQSSAFTSDLRTFFGTYLDQPFTELSTTLSKSIKEVSQHNSLADVHKLKENLSAQFKERLVDPIQKMLNNRVLSGKIEHFFEELLLIANQAPEQTALVYDLDLEKTPPQVSQRQIEWRQLVVRAIREQIVNPLQSRQQNVEEFLTEFFEEILEIENIIEINLESALAAHQERAEEEVEHPAKIAKEAMQRILTKLEELQAGSQEKQNDITNAVSSGEEEFRTSLLTLLHESEMTELQLLNAKYKVKETAKDWRTVLDSRLARGQDRLLLWSRFGWKKVKAYSSSIRKFAGFGEEKLQEAQRADIMTYLSETDRKIKELPYIYRRLFNFDAATDRRFYVPVQECSMTFNRAYEKWQKSYPATFAVVGEKGAGKTTFLNMTIDSHFADLTVCQIMMKDTLWTEQQLVELLTNELEISGAKSVDDILEVLNGVDKQLIIVLECLQNCFLRSINGYEAVEKLCYLISETEDHVFWMASCSRYAWRFLDKVMQISEYFSHTAMCDTLDAEQIKSVIMNRHRSSGYALSFEADQDTLKSRAYRKLKDQEEEAQEYLQKEYFEELTKLAQGNASVAMIFWIRSIREFDDTYCYIQPLEVASVEMIKELNPQVLFTLAAFVLHDTLSSNDLSKVLNITLEESQLLLNRLRSRGLLIEEEGLFDINHLMYRQIVRVLKERNIIHLV